MSSLQLPPFTARLHTANSPHRRISSFTGSYFGTRTRGYIDPQVSGHHTFWISARNAAELWISEDRALGKYGKRRIAAIDPKLGTGHGIPSNVSNLWDQFASQQSKSVYLEAGQSYYLEVLHQNGHGDNPHSSLAWAANGAPRTLLPAFAVESYLPTPDDTDDDYLPDTWETQYGLNPLDNGLTDAARQGERGDLDGDGLLKIVRSSSWAATLATPIPMATVKAMVMNSMLLDPKSSLPMRSPILCWVKWNSADLPPLLRVGQ